MNKVIAVYICGFVLLGILPVQAQFHNQKKGGGNQLNQGAVNASRPNQPPASGGKPSLTGRRTNGVGFNNNSTLVLTDAQRAKFRHNKLGIGEQRDLPIDQWSRSIQHEDKSYTETIVVVGVPLVKQETKSSNGVVLMSRKIKLDDRGQPLEIKMYGGRGEYKYRGIFLYDQKGRFREEQLFDTKGIPLRRKIQKYDAQGKQLPLQTFDYVENIPKDLQLVVTRESERLDNQKKIAAAEKFRKGKQKGNFFNKKTKPQPGQVAPAVARPSTTKPQKKKPSLLERLRFGKKKDKK